MGMKIFSEKLCLCCLMAIFLSVTPPALADSFMLPEIPGWDNGELKIIKLDTVSGNQGLWQERTYKLPNGDSARAIFMAGKGPGFINPPPVGITSNDGLLGAGATYETTLLFGHLTIVESHPVLGVTVSIDTPQGTITLESMTFGMHKKELVEIAEKILMSAVTL